MKVCELVSRVHRHRCPLFFKSSSSGSISNNVVPIEWTDAAAVAAAVLIWQWLRRRTHDLDQEHSLPPMSYCFAVISCACVCVCFSSYASQVAGRRGRDCSARRNYRCSKGQQQRQCRWCINRHTTHTLLSEVLPNCSGDRSDIDIVCYSHCDEGNRFDNELTRFSDRADEEKETETEKKKKGKKQEKHCSASSHQANWIDQYLGVRKTQTSTEIRHTHTASHCQHSSLGCWRALVVVVTCNEIQ